MSDRDPPPSPFSPAIAGAVIVVGLLCFAGFVVLFALGRGPNEGDGGPHAASRSAIGFAGIVELLRATGSPPLLSRDSRFAEVQHAALLVLTPRGTDARPWTLPRLRPGARVLLVQPKWATKPLPDHRGWVQSAGLMSPPAVLGVWPTDHRVPRRLRRRAGSDRAELSGPLGITLATGPIQSLQVLTATALKPLLLDRDGGVVLATDDRGFLVLSDPDVLNNQGIADERGAAGAVTLLRTLAGDGPIAFDLSLDGFGRSRDPLRAMFEPPLLGATLCAVGAALLFGLFATGRFGPIAPPARAFDAGKLALADNSAALIASAHREPALAAPYVALSRRLAAHALGLSRRLGAAETEAALDRIAGTRMERLRDLSAAADRVHDRAGLLALARRLYRWRQDLVRADR